LTPCGEELELILIRTIKGKAQSRLVFSTTDRKELAYGLFDLLLEANRTTIVLGNVGLGLGSIVRCCEEYRQNTFVDVESNVDILLSDDQELICLHTKHDAQSIVRIEAAAPRRIFIVQTITPETEDSGGPHPAESSGGPHPAESSGGARSAESSGGAHAGESSGGAHPAELECVTLIHPAEFEGVTLVSRSRMLLNLLSQASDIPEQGQEQLAALLLFPVVSSRRRNADGFLTTGPVILADSVEIFERALRLAQTARWHAGVHVAERTLSQAQFQVAYDWLREECFEKHFMFQPLKKRNKRQAFKAWQHQLMGNIHLFHAMMRHGINDVEDMLTCL